MLALGQDGTTQVVTGERVSRGTHGFSVSLAPRTTFVFGYRLANHTRESKAAHRSRLGGYPGMVVWQVFCDEPVSFYSRRTGYRFEPSSRSFILDAEPRQNETRVLD